MSLQRLKVEARLLTFTREPSVLIGFGKLSGNVFKIPASATMVDLAFPARACTNDSINIASVASVLDGATSTRSRSHSAAH